MGRCSNAAVFLSALSNYERLEKEDRVARMRRAFQTRRSVDERKRSKHAFRRALGTGCAKDLSTHGFIQTREFSMQVNRFKEKHSA